MWERRIKESAEAGKEDEMLAMVSGKKTSRGD
jgi:hypothetical protein